MRGVEKERGRPSRNGWGKNERRQRTDRGKDKRKRKRWCIKATPIASHPCTEMLQMGQCVQEEVGKHLSVRQWIFFLFFTWSAGLVTRKIEKHISTLKKKGAKVLPWDVIGLCWSVYMALAPVMALRPCTMNSRWSPRCVHCHRRCWSFH